MPVLEQLRKWMELSRNSCHEDTEILARRKKKKRRNITTRVRCPEHGDAQSRKFRQEGGLVIPHLMSAFRRYPSQMLEDRPVGLRGPQL